MKIHPIIFTGVEVRAVLSGHKTQFRRLIKPQPRWQEDPGQNADREWCGPDDAVDLMLTKPQPDENGWYKISEHSPADGTQVELCWTIRDGAEFRWGVGTWYPGITRNTLYTHWRYAQPPVDLEVK